ncbi:MAG: extracellular matrix regulator RemB [Porcipelethomonas sp.]
MYIHLGNDVVVPDRSIVGIFDIENTTTGKTTGHLLERASKEGRVVNITYEMPKSFIVCMEKGREVIYISQISVSTLRKRFGKL